jgi:tetratricopeptide (TPR) repeat protein
VVCLPNLHLRSVAKRRASTNLSTMVYVDATKLASAVLDRLHLWQRDNQALAFLAYLGKAAVETGRISQAFTILNSAETLSSQLWDNYYEPALLRERATLHYAAAEYDIAAQVAAKAYRQSEERKYYKIRAAYCQSIEALALLRQGNVSEAEKLVLTAVKAAPKKPGKYPVFAPRILYSACLVESHAGKTADAEAFCQRGLQIAVFPKLENRDLPLGYLALAEARLQAGDLAASREAALKSADLTARLFGTEHQDMVDALNLLAHVSLKEGDASAARVHVNKAIKIATALFGEGSPGAGIPSRTLLDIEKNGSRVRP